MGTPPLADLQRYVTVAVRRTSPLGSDAQAADDVGRRVLAGPRGMTPVERLDIYREQFWLRHLANLAEDFPTLSWALGGRAAFEKLAIGYLTACPPKTWDLQRLGERVAEYVASERPWRDAPFLADAARIDWAYVLAFDAPDVSPIDVHVLASTPEDAWPLATIGFHPSLSPLSLRHPAHASRRAIMVGEAAARPAPASTVVAVWRDASCCIRDAEIDPGAFKLLTELAAGRPLGEACESLTRTLEPREASALGARVTEWFQEWTARGWVATIATAA